MKIFVHLKHNLNIEKYRKSYANGVAPDLIPYGFNYAEGSENEVKYSHVSEKACLFNFIRRAFIKLFGFDFFHALYNRSSIKNSDVVWTMTENEFLGVLLLGKILGKKYKKPMLCQIIWFVNNYKPTILNRFKLYLMRDASVLMVHSKRSIDLLQQLLPSSTILEMKFGISPTRFQIRQPLIKIPQINKIKIFSAGNDLTRDWDTLLKAFGNDDRFELIIICQWLEDSYVSNFTNCILLKNPTMEDFCNLYSNSDYVVITMKDNLFSGITVAMEATACGGAVICSDTGGVNTYFDEYEITYVPVGEYAQLKRVVLELDPNLRFKKILAAQKRFIEEQYYNDRMVRDYLHITKKVINDISKPKN